MLNEKRRADRRFRAGDVIIYVVTKNSAKPGSRARHVSPHNRGDSYSYTIEKYWRVIGETARGELIAITRTGKEHVLDADDPNLHRPNWWQRLVHRSRFPAPPAKGGGSSRSNRGDAG